MNSFPANKSTSELLASGYNNAVTGFIPIIDNGIKVDNSIINICPHAWEKHPRQIIAQIPNKDIVILGCDGRLTNETGMDMNDCVRILLNLGVKFAYNLDGGGSRSTILKNKKIDVNIDGGNTERKVPAYIYFNRLSKYENLYDNETMTLVNDIKTRMLNHISDIQPALVRDLNGEYKQIVVDSNGNLTLDGYTPPPTDSNLVQDGLKYINLDGVETTGLSGDFFDTNYKPFEKESNFTMFIKYLNVKGTNTDNIGTICSVFKDSGNYTCFALRTPALCMISGSFGTQVNENNPSNGDYVTVYIVKNGNDFNVYNGETKKVFVSKIVDSPKFTVDTTLKIGCDTKGDGVNFRYHKTSCKGIVCYNRALTEDEIDRNLIEFNKL